MQCFFDIHTHNSKFRNGFSIINLSIDEAKTVLSANKKDLFSIGLHPWNIDTTAEEQLQKVEEIANHPRIVAIGECGLDNTINISVENQVQLFEKHIEISEIIQKPLIIHCVGCFNQLFEVKKRKNTSQPWIIHGFRGKPQLAAQILKMNCGISFGENFNPESVKITPVENLFVETDVSDIPIEEVYKKIAILKKCDPLALNAGNLLFL